MNDNHLLFFEKILGGLKRELERNNDGFYKKSINTFSHTVISDEKKILQGKRDLRAHKIVAGWLKNINDQLTYKRATPKNYTWFDDCYVLPLESDNSEKYRKILSEEGCWSTYDSNEFCSYCENGYDRQMIVKPNSCDRCIDYMINNIYNSSDIAWRVNDIRNSRYALLGKAGEGKSAFINYILSCKQDEMWKKRLITIRIVLSRPDFIGPYQELVNDGKPKYDRYMLIKNTILKKMVRILSAHYFNKRTNTPVDESRNECIAQELKDLIEYRWITSRDMVRTCFLEYKGARPSDNEIIDVINVVSQSEDERFKTDVNKLLCKVIHSLSEDEQDAIIDKVQKELNIESIEDIRLQYFIRQLDREKASKIPDDLIIETIKAMGSLDYPYRFFVILDGLDPHHQNETIERVIPELISDLGDILFLDVVSMINGAYMLVMREETVERHLYNARFQGALWGNFIKLGVSPVMPCEIFGKRLQHVSKNAYQIKMSSCFISFCSKFFAATLDERNVGKIERLDKKCDEGFPLFSLLFRGNRRTMLKFMNTFMRDVYITLEKKGIPLDHLEKNITKKSANDAHINAVTYFSEITESHTFWDSVLYRDQKYYFNPLGYSYSEFVLNDKKRKILERKLIGIEYEYEVFPNIFNPIPIKDTLQDDNLTFLKMFIMKIIENAKNIRKSVLMQIVTTVFDRCDTNQIDFEIDELIVNRFVYVTPIEPELWEDPFLSVTIYWVHFDRWFWFIDVFIALASDISYPDNNVFRYEHYASYVSRNNEWLRHRETRYTWNEMTKKAFASKIISLSIAVSYLGALDWYYRRKYDGLHKELINVSDIMKRISYNHISMEKGLKKVFLKILSLSQNPNVEHSEYFEEQMEMQIEETMSDYKGYKFYDKKNMNNVVDQWWMALGDII